MEDFMKQKIECSHIPTAAVLQQDRIQILHVFVLSKLAKYKLQAGAELGQAQFQLELVFTLI